MRSWGRKVKVWPRGPGFSSQAQIIFGKKSFLHLKEVGSGDGVVDRAVAHIAKGCMIELHQSRTISLFL